MSASRNAKTIANLGVARENAFGYAQVVQVKDTLYIFGQFCHDRQGSLVAPAALDASGRPADFSIMEEQNRQSYTNAIALLAQFGVSLDDVVEETLYVFDVPAAFVAGARSARKSTERTCRKSRAISLATDELNNLARRFDPARRF